MSREVWKADFQIQVWQKIQTLNPENPGIALEPASESLFFNPTHCFRRRGFYVENVEMAIKSINVQCAPRKLLDVKCDAHGAIKLNSSCNLNQPFCEFRESLNESA